MKNVGFGGKVELVEKGKCPFCAVDIHPNKDFRDDLSLKEYKISGLCQKCQDQMFGG